MPNLGVGGAVKIRVDTYRGVYTTVRRHKFPYVSVHLPIQKETRLLQLVHRPFWRPTVCLYYCIFIALIKYMAQELYTPSFAL